MTSPRLLSVSPRGAKPVSPTLGTGSSCHHPSQVTPLGFPNLPSRGVSGRTPLSPSTGVASATSSGDAGGATTAMSLTPEPRCSHGGVSPQGHGVPTARGGTHMVRPRRGMGTLRHTHLSPLPRHGQDVAQLEVTAGAWGHRLPPEQLRWGQRTGAIGDAWVALGTGCGGGCDPPRPWRVPGARFSAVINGDEVAAGQRGLVRAGAVSSEL